MPIRILPAFTTRTRGATLLLLLFALSSCGYGHTEGAHTALSADEARAEYWAEAKKLKLAPGWTWPADTPEGVGILETDPDDGDGMVYGAGYGRNWATDYWFCSWQHRALSPDISPSQRDEALSQADKVRRSAMYTDSTDQNGKKLYAEVLDTAKLGDLSAMREFFRRNCSHHPE